ncbi:macrophage migration inhibitory factor-like [Protopterus annectens]|uniref:macrophage migration inhibitory factor-like n=1 Tax=Protopterus annectens TaxID=7888 RepID=UPI001CFA4D9A|nr:macrophage migration inhibitory factor-like [Protopterus annectens]
MPIFKVYTNARKSAATKSLLEELNTELDKALGKREAESIAIHIDTDKLVSFGGTTELCAVCSFTNIGKSEASKNKTYSKLFSDLLNKHLGISAERIYIHFIDVPVECAGWKGTLFCFL